MIEEKDWTTEEAYLYCEKVASARPSPLPLNPRFLSRDIRPHFCSIAAFWVFAEDFSNSPDYIENLRPFFIENWESQLLQCVWRKPKNPVFIALRETLIRFNIPVGSVQDFLSAYRLDMAGREYSSIADLVDNFLHSARAAGRLALQILGDPETETRDLFDDFCSGIRLAHLWEDVPSALKKGRNYLPLETRRRHGYRDEDLRNGRFNPAFRSLMAELVNHTRGLLLKSRPLSRQVDPRIRFEITRIWHGGTLLLDRIEQRDFNVFGPTPGFSMLDHMRLLFRAAFPLKIFGGKMEGKED